MGKVPGDVKEMFLILDAWQAAGRMHNILARSMKRLGQVEIRSRM